MSDEPKSTPAGDSEREEQLESLIADYIRDSEAGRDPERQALLKQYPEYASELTQFFGQRDRINRLVDPIREFGDDLYQSIGPGKQLSYVGNYELLEEVARGGMGVVYKARQTTLGRIVAVKMIVAGRLAKEQDVQRFLSEAEAAASLQHPNIVPIHEVGQHEGWHYFSMDYVEGRDLSTILRERVLPAKTAATYVRQMAEAIHYAHQHGILHRDLKPSNILIDQQNQVHITDFGLAMRVESDQGLTQTGQILGTPSYMPPEQAQGKKAWIGPASDVYALGAILYECLTGRPPFRADSVIKTLEQVIHVEAASPRKLNAAVPRDLETICLKCLAKEPQRRYATAQLLADDIHRFLDGRPILARPISNPARVFRWCRRNPFSAATAMLAVASILAFTMVANIAYVREASLRRDLEAEQETTSKALHASQTAVADMRTYSGLSAADRGENAVASLWFASAVELLGEEHPRSQYNRIRAAIWNRLAPRPSRAVVHPEEWVMKLSFHPSGQYLMSSSPKCGPHSGLCAVWSLEEERQIQLTTKAGSPSCGVWSQDGKILAIGTNEGHLLLQQFPDGKITHDILLEERVDLLELDPTGKYLAAVYGKRAPADPGAREAVFGSKLRVWDLVENEYVVPELQQPNAITAVMFDPQGKQVIVGNASHFYQSYSLSSNSDSPISPKLPMFQYGPSIVIGERPAQPVFLERGQRLLTFRPLKLWDTTTWSPLALPEPVANLPSQIDKTVATNSGQVIVAGLRGTAVLDARTLQEQRFLECKSRQWVFDVAVSPDGRYLLSGSGDRNAQLWELPSATLVGTAMEHMTSVLAVAWSTDSQTFATAQRGGLVRIWKMPSDPIQRASLAPGGVASLSPSGRLVASSGSTQRASGRPLTRVFSTVDGSPLGPELRTEGPLLGSAFSPDEKSLAMLIAGVDLLKIVDWTSGEPRSTPLQMPSQPRSVQYHEDGKMIGVLCAGGEILLINSSDLTIQKSWSNQVARLTSTDYTDNGMLKFGPDGETLITFQTDPAVRVWNWKTTSLRYKIDGHTDRCSAIAFSPDAKLMATGSRDNTARVWDSATGAAISEPLPHPDWIFSVQFHPRQEWLIVSCRDAQVRVWNWRTARLVCPPLQHDHEVHSATFTPDGRFAVTASEDGTARVWELATGRPIVPPIQLGEAALKIEITPDGRRLVVGGFPTGLLHLVSLDCLYDLDYLDPSKRRLSAELSANSSLVGTGGLANLSTGEWLLDWENVRSWGATYASDLDRFRERIFRAAPKTKSSADHTDTAESNSTTPPMIPAIPIDQAGATALKWSVSVGKPRKKHSLAFSADGQQIVSRTETAIKVWSIKTGDLLHELPVAADVDYYDFAFAPQASVLAAAAVDGVHVFGLEQGQENAVINVDETTKSSFHRVVFSPDGEWLAGAHMNGVNVWETGNWKRVALIASNVGWIGALAFNQNGSLLATGGQDKHVRTWRTTDWSMEIDRLAVGKIYTVAFSPTDGTVAAAVESAFLGQIQYWDALSEKRMHAAAAHGKLANTIAYRTDGQRIATAGDDGTVALWDAALKRVELRFQAHGRYAFCALFSPDGTLLATLGDDGMVKLWDAAKLDSLTKVDVPAKQVPSEVSAPTDR